jgi:P-type Ca2+ transporter type 2C
MRQPVPQETDDVGKEGKEMIRLRGVTQSPFQENEEKMISREDASRKPHPIPIFPLLKETLMDLIEERSQRQLEDLDRIEGIARALHTDLEKGLYDSGIANLPDANSRDLLSLSEEGSARMGLLSKSHSYMEQRRETYGRNILPEVQSKSLLRLMFEAWNDRTLIFLSIASLISLGVGIYEDVRDRSKIKWIEGFAILAAVIIVVIVTALNDYQKERNFRKLNARKNDRTIKIVRNGEQGLISVFDVCVGDVIIMASGDILCADGILIEGRGLKCDESSMTGESESVKKAAGHDVFLLSGTKVLEGQGRMLVVAVGPYSLHGKMMMSLRVPNQLTPLQKKLAHLAEKVAIFGLTVALLLLVILVIKYLVQSAIHGWASGANIVSDITHLFIEAITILVVAIPEGLPMAVTLALAYSSIQMLKDQNLVRVLASCETMGNATTICSDKTGTLTQNKMTVVSGYLSEMSFESLDGLRGFARSLDPRVRTLLCEGIAVNSTAYEDKTRNAEDHFVGSKTEVVLLEFLQKLEGPPYQDIRRNSKILDVIPFSSDRKRMSTVIELPNGRRRLYCKGAAEIVLKRCSTFLSMHGDIEPLANSKRRSLEDIILSYASDALRTICFAYRDFEAKQIESLGASWLESAEHELTCIGIVGIQDPLRPEVCEAVSKCQRAGIVVRMVTGDSKCLFSAIRSVPIWDKSRTFRVSSILCVYYHSYAYTSVFRHDNCSKHRQKMWYSSERRYCYGGIRISTPFTRPNVTSSSKSPSTRTIISSR